MQQMHAEHWRNTIQSISVTCVHGFQTMVQLHASESTEIGSRIDLNSFDTVAKSSQASQTTDQPQVTQENLHSCVFTWFTVYRLLAVYAYLQLEYCLATGPNRFTEVLYISHYWWSHSFSVQDLYLLSSLGVKLARALSTHCILGSYWLT